MSEKQCEPTGELYILARYSKVQSKKAIKEYLMTNASDPKIDLQDPVSGRYGTPEQIREVTGCKDLAFTIQKRSPIGVWMNATYGRFVYNEKTKKWRFT